MLFPKKNQVLLSLYQERIEMAGGIAVPEIASKPGTPKFRVVNLPFGMKSADAFGLHPGSAVAVQNLDKVSTVKLSFNGRLFYAVELSDVVAEFPDLSEFCERIDAPKEKYNELPEDAEKFRASGDSFIIAPYPKLDFASVNGIIVPMGNRELQRSHIGTVISVGAKAAEKTGFKAGQVVLYDYYGAFGHEWKYDAVRSENVLAALSVFGHGKMMKQRQHIEEKARP